MGTPHKHAELIKAWADGVEIEYWNETTAKWENVIGTPTWNTKNNYRIKKNIVKTVGYRRYLMEEDGKCYVYSVHEDKLSPQWEAQAKTGFCDSPWKFIKWLDTEFQYEEVEL